VAQTMLARRRLKSLPALPPATVCIAALLTGCGGSQSALNPHGPAASDIADLWWVLFWTSVAVGVVVLQQAAP